MKVRLATTRAPHMRRTVHQAPAAATRSNRRAHNGRGPVVRGDAGPASGPPYRIRARATTPGPFAYSRRAMTNSDISGPPGPAQPSSPGMLDPAIEKIIRDRVESSAFAHWMGFTVVSFGDGTSELSLEVKEHHLNPGGIIHGGVIASMLDGAIGLALRTRIGMKRQHVTLQLGVQYLAMARSGIVRAIGTAVHTGTTTGAGEASLLDERGKLLAKATGTFLIVPPEVLAKPPESSKPPSSSA